MLNTTVQRVSVVEGGKAVTGVTTSASRRRPFLLFSAVMIHNCRLCFGSDVKILQCSEVIRLPLLPTINTRLLRPHIFSMSPASIIIMRRNRRENCALEGYFAASGGRERTHQPCPVKSNPVY